MPLVRIGATNLIYTLDNAMNVSRDDAGPPVTLLVTSGYQQEMLNDRLHRNVPNTGSGKIHIAALRLKHEGDI